MTTRQVVNELRARGHRIRYKVRKDGGILITSIDGTKYTAAAGNTIARQIVGDTATLSQAQKTQLKIIKPEKGKKAKTDLLNEDIKARIKEVQKEYNKNKVPISQGRITRRLIRKIIREEGVAAAEKKLEQSERYATGYAISKVVQGLADYVRQAALLIDSDELDELADEIEANDGRIRDEDIYPAYKALYEINHGKDIKDVVEAVKRILRI